MKDLRFESVVEDNYDGGKDLKIFATFIDDLNAGDPTEPDEGTPLYRAMEELGGDYGGEDAWTIYNRDTTLDEQHVRKVMAKYDIKPTFYYLPQDY